MDDSHFRRREFAVLLKKAGLPHVRFHDLRHTAAALLFAQRVNAKAVSEMLGHSGIAITPRVYGPIKPPMQHAAASSDGGSCGRCVQAEGADDDPPDKSPTYRRH